MGRSAVKGKKSKRKSVEDTEPRQAPALRRVAEDSSDEEELVFDDPYEDELEEEELVNSTEVEEKDDLADEMEDLNDQMNNLSVFQPGVDTMGEDEELVFDSSVYDCLHRLNVNFPSLSFDVIRDKLGMCRKKFPHTVYLAMGTANSSSPKDNSISLLKTTDLHKTKYDDRDPESDYEDSDDDADACDDDPTLVERSFSHYGCVNRLRSMPQLPHILATFSDQGIVNIFDAEQELKALDTPPTHKIPPVQPIYVCKLHNQEGYALDWNALSPGTLLSGDGNGKIMLTEMREGSWMTHKKAFTSHSSSVEDLQWSPGEASVFASCSVDCTIKIWDARAPKKAQLTVKAHDMDVNVMSWCQTVQHHLASGSDDTTFKVWDLRMFKSDSPAGCMQWHKGPITSIEWHPTDESGTVLAVSSEDHSITIWDMSVEADPEHTAQGAKLTYDVPPQLMFVHQGQEHIKELHYHPQIPSMVVSTAATGLNFIKPFNI